MRCSIASCPGEYEQREVVRAVRQGNRIIVIEHIQAEVCNVCGLNLHRLRSHQICNCS